MEQRKIFFALPSKDDAFCADTVICLMRSVAEIIERGWSGHSESRQWDHYVDRARNVMVSQFLRSDCTDMVWIDDDIAWASGDIIRLIEHPVDFVAGAYRVKDPNSKRYVLRFVDNEFVRDDETGLIEMTGVGFGFVRIKRQALLSFYNSRSDHWYVDHLSGLRTHELFSIKLKPDHSGPEGEDYTFCRRWRRWGGKVWLDPDLRLTHVGAARFYGCLSEDLARMGQQQPIIKRMNEDAA